MGFLFYIPAGVISLTLLLLTMLVIEGGFRIGSRVVHHDASVDSAVGVVQNSILGLMAFLLGLSFTFTAGRFETRHDLEQKEANCLGTAYVRTQLIDHPLGAQIRALLPQYVEARWNTYEAGIVGNDAYLRAKARSDELQAQIWKCTADVFREDKTDKRTALLTQTLNDAFDAAGDVEEARRHRVPEIIFLLLFSAVLLSAGFVGYVFGRTGARVLPAWFLFSAVTAVTIFVILDLDRPERGLIRDKHTPLKVLRHSLN